MDAFGKENLMNLSHVEQTMSTGIIVLIRMYMDVCMYCCMRVRVCVFVYMYAYAYLYMHVFGSYYFIVPLSYCHDTPHFYYHIIITIR